MSHLSTLKSQAAMVFYSLLTFFLVPYFTTPLLPGTGPNKCIVGFTIGFLISIMLWFMFGEMLTAQ